MIVRIAYFKELPQRALEPGHDEFRKWMTEQPGFVRAHHCRNSDTGEAVSISYWDSSEALAELSTKTPPRGPIGMKPDRVDVFDVEHEF